MKKKPLEIVVVQGGGRGARHPLTAPHVVLGRLEPNETAPAASLLFPEPTVSRIHATLDWDAAANRYLLTHRSATNPTLVNKAKVTKPRHVGPGDKIQMGNLLIEVRVGIGQHSEVELETVDFTALTKMAANQVYRPESLMPEAPAIPSAEPAYPQEIPAPIPAPIPPPARRQLPQPVFNEPYAPVEYVPSPLPAINRPEPALAPKQFFEFPEADEQVTPVAQLPGRRIQLSSLPRQDVEEPNELDARLQNLQIEETGKLGLPAALEAQLTEEAQVIETEQTPTEIAIDPEEPSPSEGEAPVSPDEPPLTTPEPLTEPEPEPKVEEKPKQKPIRREKPKIGRNEKCPCGSGKKYKKCCGRS